MMAARKKVPRLVDRLPLVRGAYTENEDLARTTWFRVGGPAEVTYRPADIDDLKGFMADKPDDVPVTIIGIASNLLVRDGGVPGVVIRLADAFSGIEIEGVEVAVGAAASNLKVANACRDASLAGLEFLSGIPGSVGGALAMNAGAFGAEMKDVVSAVTALDATGTVRELTPDAMGFGYRQTAAPADWIFVAARLVGTTGDKAEIAARMREIAKDREVSQPSKSPTGGSTFINPPGEKAWELIDRAGCRGLVRGGAKVSEKHCNFLINTGRASAADLEGLGEEVRRRVFAATGVSLEWEIRRIGVADGPAVRESGR